MKRTYSKKITGAVLGVMALSGLFFVPVAQAATQDTTINSTIGSVLSLFTVSPSTVDVSVTPTAAGAQSIAGNTVTVSTNGPGYTLQLSDKDANNNLVSGGNSIAPGTGTLASPAALTSGQWGFRVDGVGGFGNGPTSAVSNGALSATTFAAVPPLASPATIRNTSASASNEATTFWYSVAANTGQASGTYTDTVTYTALAK